MGAFGYYLIIINVIGFILFVANTWLYSNAAEGQVDKFLTITSLLGESLAPCVRGIERSYAFVYNWKKELEYEMIYRRKCMKLKLPTPFGVLNLEKSIL